MKEKLCGLPKKIMVELFNVTPKNITKHITNIFESIELVKNKTNFNPNKSTNNGIRIINPNLQNNQHYTTLINYICKI